MSIYRVGSLGSNKTQVADFMIDNHELPEAWFEEMRRRTKILWDLQDLHISWLVSHANYDELNLCIGKSCKDLTLSREIYLISGEVQGEKLKISQLITNCVVSFTSFITIAEQHMKRRRNNFPAQFCEWDDERKNLHEKCFSYRLGYQLRNYSQHYSIPLSGFCYSLNSKSIEGLMPYVNVKDLLRGGFNWNKMKGELEQRKDDNIDMLLLLREYLECVDLIFKKSIFFHSDDLCECYEFISNICNSCGIKEDEHPVVFIGETMPGEKVPSKMEFIPSYLLNWMKMEWKSKVDFDIDELVKKQAGLDS